MREFVIKQWRGLATERARGPVPEEHPGSVSSHTSSIRVCESASPEHLSKPDSLPAEEAPPAPKVEESPPPTPAARRRGERNFVVAYEGRFVGVFEAEEELTPREAFLRVAGDLSGRKDFDPEKLQLYKPVLLRSARPPKGGKFVSGTLTEIGGRIREGRDNDAAHASPRPPRDHADPAASERQVEEHVCQDPA